jgi:2'-5' RNA ligase
MELHKIQLEFRKCIQANIRWVPVQNIHLTIRYLGETPESKLEIIKQILSNSSNLLRNTSLEINDVGAFPNTSKPRVLWAGVQENEQLSQFHTEIDTKLVNLGFPADRPIFTPHLTIGRLSEAIAFDTRDKISQIIGSFHTYEIGHFTIQSIILFQSILGPTGARYVKIFET